MSTTVESIHPAAATDITSQEAQLTSLLLELTSDLDVLKLRETTLNSRPRAQAGLQALATIEEQHSSTSTREQQVQGRVYTLEMELAGSITARDEAVAALYPLESRLTQALKDCQGLSSSSATMRAQQRRDYDKINALESKVRDLEDKLKNSVPAEKVQSVLEAAAQRVSGICDGAQKSQHNLDRAKREIKRLQAVIDNIPTLIEEKAQEQIRQRRRSDAIAKEATKRADKLERKLIELEQSTNQLRGMLKSAQEGIGVMKTIARIRNTELGGKGGGGSIGFDAVAKTIDGVSRQVDARMRMKKMKKMNGTRRRRKDNNNSFANFENEH